MKKIKICTPVIGKTLNEFLKNLEQIQEISEMVELKVDNIRNLSEKNLQLIRKKTVKEVILTSRKKEIILKALNLGFDFIDIDLSLIKDFNLPKKIKSNIIISFHDFKKTPDVNKLEEILNKIREFKQEIIKIATMVNNKQDVGNLFKTLLNKKVDEKIIIVGMGKKGRVTRIFGPLFGSFLTFAKTKYGLSEQGQIDITKLKNIYKLIT
ncbi:MAG: 3-dehydroquinate dehydratase [Candidatus Roizmanbacteria bacterium GW2011_GWA2_32_13]|uniref:3-dehydroquinate dehydratase n=1 Tax=Candidatus Roizmanbacteria bacterium GW2011_GWA2_32_13 TaxID=1618475 RepID=A0A0F9YZQ9_9BACT|nr:MAG: 3-dehydroquinate dehydratase [Candidatus Roizmanbacteria bacterium GW2011_GWA2_32_13]